MYVPTEWVYNDTLLGPGFLRRLSTPWRLKCTRMIGKVSVWDLQVCPLLRRLLLWCPSPGSVLYWRFCGRNSVTQEFRLAGLHLRECPFNQILPPFPRVSVNLVHTDIRLYPAPIVFIFLLLDQFLNEGLFWDASLPLGCRSKLQLHTLMLIVCHVISCMYTGWRYCLWDIHHQ